VSRLGAFAIMFSVSTSSSGSPRTDAQFDFSRARRRRAFDSLVARLRREPSDISAMLPFDEVVAALGYVSERSLGLLPITLDSIVGSVDRNQDFDRRFRPRTPRVRARWESIAAAYRRGESMPPIEVYRIGSVHFVRDGHHRVSVARQLGLGTINALVTEVITKMNPTEEALLRTELSLFSHQRVFADRVPLTPEQRARIDLRDEWRFAALAEGVEAWGFRLMQERHTFMARDEVARTWFAEEYEPVVALLREADMLPPGNETETYMKVVALRYLLLQSHEWGDEIIERLRDELARPRPTVDDTLVHRLHGELR
jgi:hypothetical protein